MAKKTEQLGYLSKAITAIDKGFGPGAAVMMGGSVIPSTITEVIPTGISVIDHAVLGRGGLPVGRMVEVFGPESIGKSSFIFQCLAQAQREEDGIAVLAESEQALEQTRFEAFGGDPERLLLMQPDSLEKMLGQFEMLLDNLPEKHGPILFAWDSIAASPTEDEVKKGLMGEAAVAEKARCLSHACPLMLSLAIKHRVCLLFVNQVRDKLGGGGFGPKTTTPGGHAVKFFSTARIAMSYVQGGTIKQGIDTIGRVAKFTADKNKMSPPFKSAEVKLDFEKGWDNIWSTLAYAKDRKLIPDGARATPDNYKLALKELGWDSPAEPPAF